MVVSPEILEMHLNFFAKYFTIVGIDSLSNPKPKSTFRKPRLIVTFDDGWVDNFRYAFPLLQKHNVPACIYLVTEMINTNRSFWPNVISKCIHDGLTDQLISAFQITPPTDLKVPTRELCAQLIAQIKSRSDTEIWAILAANQWDTPADDADRLLSWEEIDTMYGTGLITFGSHTCNHLRLTKNLPESIIKRELTESAKSLDERIGTPCLHFCYPNGDSSNVAEKDVENTYVTAVTTEKGINTPATDKLRLKRIGVFDDVTKTTMQLRARLNG